MAEIGRLLALCASAFCLGIAFIVFVLFSMSARYSGDRAEGCMGKLFTLGGLVLAAFFLYLALTLH